MRNISAVHRPMPRTSVSSLTIFSSERRATRSSSTSPASTRSARSRIDAVLLADSPAARIVSTGSASTASGVDVTVEGRLEPTVDRARRRPGQLLEADRPHQLGEVRAPRSGAAEIGGPERLDVGRELRGLPGERGGSLDHRPAHHARHRSRDLGR